MEAGAVRLAPEERDILHLFLMISELNVGPVILRAPGSVTAPSPT
jgi:hypothetical protein